MQLENILKGVKRFGAGVLLSAYLFSGCSKDDGASIQNNFNLKDKVEILSSNDLGNIIEKRGDSLCFFGDFDFEVGDILAGETSEEFPYGFLKEVKSIEGNWVITKDAPLDKAFEGEISFDESVSSFDKSASSWNHSFDDFVIYDYDGNLQTTGDQISLSGDIDFSLDINGRIKLNSNVREFYFGVDATNHSELEIDADIQKTFEERCKIFNKDFPPLIIPTGAAFPLVFKPNLEIYIGGEGNVNANFNSKIKNNLEFTAAVEFDGSWDYETNFSNSFSFEEPIFSGNVGASAYINAKLNFLFYGVSGPSVEIIPSLIADIESTRTPVWRMSGALEGRFGFDAEMLSEYVSDYSVNIFHFEEVLGEGGVGSNSGEIGSITDSRDGKTYKTIQIGGQKWLGENLDYDSPNSHYYEYNSSYSDLGRFYEGHEAKTVCPNGWHLPSDGEWKSLESYLGMPQNELDLIGDRGGNQEVGKKLKEGGSSGMDLLLSGKGEYNLSMEDIYWGFKDDYGYYWTSTPSGTKLYDRAIKIFDEQVFRSRSEIQNIYFPVRCVKD
jgi:uncharacterized protein (TIGR02145 family)